MIQKRFTLLNLDRVYIYIASTCITELDEMRPCRVHLTDVGTLKDYRTISVDSIYYVAIHIHLNVAPVGVLDIGNKCHLSLKILGHK